MEILWSLIDGLSGKVSLPFAIGRALGTAVAVALLTLLVWALFCRRRERDTGKKG